MQKIYFKSSSNEKLRELSSPVNGCWIDIENADHPSVKEMAKFLNIEYANLHDSLDIYEIPRIERRDDKVIIYARYPGEKIEDLYTQTMCIVLTPSLFISISKNQNKIVKDLLKEPSEINTTQTSKLLIAVLYEITREYTQQINIVRRKVMKHKKDITQVDDQEIITLTEYEDILNQYLSALQPLDHVLDTIVAGKYIDIYESDVDLLDDLDISVSQSVDLCRVSLKSIQSLRDSHQMFFTNKLNRTIQLLTVFTIIMTVPTIIAGLWGMNVVVPFEQHPNGFVVILSLSIIVGLLIFIFFRMRRWV